MSSSILFLLLVFLAGSSLGEVVGMEEYWRELAERRRAALADTLMENEEVCAFTLLIVCVHMYITH